MNISEIIGKMECSIESDSKRSTEYYSKAIQAARYFCDGACDFFKTKNQIAKAFFDVKDQDLVFGAYINSSDIPCISFSKTNFFLNGYTPLDIVIGKGSMTYVDRNVYVRFDPSTYQTDDYVHAGFVWNDKEDTYVAEYSENPKYELPRMGWIGKLKSSHDKAWNSGIMIRVHAINSDMDIQDMCIQSFIDILPNTPSKPSCERTMWNGEQWISPEAHQ